MLIVKLCFGKEVKRNTYWKFNSSLLKHKQYSDETNDEINTVVEQYAASHYDKVNNLGIARSDLDLAHQNMIEKNADLL